MSVKTRLIGVIVNHLEDAVQDVDGPHGQAGDRLVVPRDSLETTKVGEHRGELICDVARDGVIGPGYIIYIYIYVYIYIFPTHTYSFSAVP